MTDSSSSKTPFGVTEQLGLFLRSLRQRFGGFILLGLLMFLVIIGIGIVVGGIGGGLIFAILSATGRDFGDLAVPLAVANTGNPLPLLFSLGPAAIIALVLWVVFHFFSSIFYTAPTQAGLNVLQNGKVEAGGSLGRGFGLLIKAGLVLLVITLAFTLVQAIFVWLPAMVLPGSAGVMLSGLGNIPYILFAIIVGLAIAPWPAVVVHEGKGLDALGRAAFLTKGYRLPILGFGLLATLVILAVCLGVFLVIASIGVLLLILTNSSIGMVVGTFLSLILGVPFGLGLMGGFGLATAVVYVRLVQIKEGSLSHKDVEEVFG